MTESPTDSQFTILESVTISFDCIKFNSARPPEDRFTLTLLNPVQTYKDETTVVSELILSWPTRAEVETFCREQGLYPLFDQTCPDFELANAQWFKDHL